MTPVATLTLIPILNTDSENTKELCMKNFIIQIILSFLLWAPAASAFTFEWRPLDSTLAATGTFAEGWGNTMPDWDITEGSRAWDDWLVSGAANKTSYDSNTSKLWLKFGSASTTLTTETDSVVFLMHGDFNDGLGNFYVDNQLIDTHDLYDGGSSGLFQAMIVTGLDLGIHTLKVEWSGQKNSLSTGYDLAIIGGGAIAPSAVPVPAAIWMLGSGLLVLTGFNRKQSSKG